MHPLLNIAITAARSASKIILRSLERVDLLVITEKRRNDFVTEVDKQSEQDIIDIILKAYPDHAILGEESGKTGTNDYQWIIDPLDGTTNFIHGLPHFSISIAVKHKDQIEHGVIYDPLRDELFYASRGNGAYLNNRRIRVSKSKQLNGSLLGTGFGQHTLEHMHDQLAIIAEFVPEVAGIRRCGSAALDLAYVACGHLDGFWEMKLRPWDIAAGAAIITEAGGVITDFHGHEAFLDSGNVIASNPKIFKIIYQAIQEKLKNSIDQY
ncbi:MAG: inositol monophosphatase [Gammaproteobacteria bacterium]|nr:inositol monophosphatase [Gammaproteobacteria bacterium]